MGKHWSVGQQNVCTELQGLLYLPPLEPALPQQILGHVCILLDFSPVHHQDLTMWPCQLKVWDPFPGLFNHFKASSFLNSSSITLKPLFHSHLLWKAGSSQIQFKFSLSDNLFILACWLVIFVMQGIAVSFTYTVQITYTVPIT